MATQTFTVDVHIDSPKERVGRFISDFANYGKIHPLIKAIHSSPPRPGARLTPADDRRWYKVTDRLPIGPIAVSFTYDVAMAAAGPLALLFEAWQWPQIHLRNRTAWRDAESGGTYLCEEVTVQAPRLLLSFVARTAEQAHRRAFAALKELLESEPPRNS